MAKISLKKWKELNDIKTEKDLEEVLKEAMDTGSCPAVCDQECQTEPDGECPHGAPSLMIVLGII